MNPVAPRPLTASPNNGITQFFRVFIAVILGAAILYLIRWQWQNGIFIFMFLGPYADSLCRKFARGHILL